MRASTGAPGTRGIGRSSTGSRSGRRQRGRRGSGGSRAHLCRRRARGRGQGRPGEGGQHESMPEEGQGRPA
eukprot:9563637-Lingulodinium_polyedra.AAC.1